MLESSCKKHGMIKRLGFLILSLLFFAKLIESSDNKFTPKVTRIDSLLSTDNGKTHKRPGKGVQQIFNRLSNKILRFDDSHQLLSLNDDYTIRFSPNSGETWKTSSVPKKVKNAHDFSEKELKHWENILKDDKYFIPDYITVDPFYSGKRAFVFSVGTQYEFLFTEDQGSSFELISLKNTIDSGIEKLIASAGSEFSNHVLTEIWLSEIETNSDYNNIMVKYFIELTNEKNEDDLPFYGDMTLISTNKGKSFKIISPTDSEYLSMHCEFLDKETGNLVSTTDIICNQKSFVKDPESDKGVYLKTEKSMILISNDLGNTLREVPEFKDKFINWKIVYFPYIIVYSAVDKHNPYKSQDVFISNDGGKSFHKAIMPSDDISMGQASWTNAFAYPINEKLLLSVISYNPPDNSDTMKFNPDYYKQDTFISDSTGLKFTPLSEVIDYKQNSNNIINGFESLRPLSNFKGVFTLASSALDHISEGNSNQNKSPVFIVNPSFISFDAGTNWETFNVKNDKSFKCNPESSKSCLFRSFAHSLDFSELDPSYDYDLLQTPGIYSIKGLISEDGLIDGTDVEKQISTFLTRDFGKSWEKIFDFPVSLSYGDYGNIIVAVPEDPDLDDDPNQEFFYSLDQGKTWNEYEFKDNSDGSILYWRKIVPLVKDGSSYQFIASGYKINGKNFDSDNHFLLDFSQAFNGQICNSNDFEKVKLNEDKCINGKSFSYQRRKLESECLVGTEYKNLEAEIDICECTEEDFECSDNFVRGKDGSCLLDISLITASGVCLNEKSNVETFVKRLKNNNSCKNSNKFTIEKETINCKDLGITKGDGKIIIHEETSFDSAIMQYQYFNTWQHDSILVRTKKGTLYVSTNGGVSFKKFDQLEANEKIEEVLFNKYNGKYSYILTSQNNLFITNDAGRTFFKNSNAIPPDTIQLAFPLDVSRNDANKLIYYGGANCENIFNKDCHSQSYISKDGGQSFEKLLENAIHCEFINSPANSENEHIMCEVKLKDSQLTSIVVSSDYFKSDKKVIFDKSSVGFVSYKDFTIIANVEENSLKGYITMDGVEFAGVKLPKAFDDFDQRSFTIAGSTAGSIIMHLTTESTPGLEYGALLKSNSNGTMFVTIERAVNRNSKGYVDFEYVGDLEGVFITNVVANPGEETKKLKTKLSFNDGAVFRYLTPPARNFKGEKYTCLSTDLEKCSLNLHSYSDRTDFRDTLSSGAGVGLLIGVGSVGEYLLPYNECSTFLSTDGGISWKEISSKPYQYEFGDRGNIIVLASHEKTDSIIYSKNQGLTWETLKISESPILLRDIITNPTDSSLKFLLVSEDHTVSINFAEMFERQCSFENSNDFEYKPLLHPDSKCVFGHEIEYIHKKNENCFVGMAPIQDKYKITKNCTCTRDDYECDYNYELSANGICKLVDGLSALDPLEMCAKDPALVEVFNPTGYRKNALSTCKGGKVLDIPSSLPQACPGKEEEFKKLHSVSSQSSFFFVVLSLIAMSFTLWVVYERGIKRNGGFARFGEIRLRDDDDADDIIEENFGDVIVNRIVSFGVLGFYGLSNIYNKLGKPSGRILNKFAHVLGLKRTGFRNQSYSSLSTDTRFNTFVDDGETENSLNVNDDLLFGNDEDANNISAFADEDINFDINEHLNDEDTSFLPYNDEVSIASGDHQNSDN